MITNAVKNTTLELLETLIPLLSSPPIVKTLLRTNKSEMQIKTETRKEREKARNVLRFLCIMPPHTHWTENNLYWVRSNGSLSFARPRFPTQVRKRKHKNKLNETPLTQLPLSAFLPPSFLPFLSSFISPFRLVFLTPLFPSSSFLSSFLLFSLPSFLLASLPLPPFLPYSFETTRIFFMASVVFWHF